MGSKIPILDSAQRLLAIQLNTVNRLNLLVKDIEVYQIYCYNVVPLSSSDVFASDAFTGGLGMLAFFFYSTELTSSCLNRKWNIHNKLKEDTDYLMRLLRREIQAIQTNHEGLETTSKTYSKIHSIPQNISTYLVFKFALTSKGPGLHTFIRPEAVVEAMDHYRLFGKDRNLGHQIIVDYSPHDVKRNGSLIAGAKIWP